MSEKDAPRLYSVSASKKKAVLDFILDALRACRCTILYEPPVDRAPYRIVFDTPEGERIGILAYAFFANSRLTRNRPDDEHRLQVKYGKKDGDLHSIWQDPYGLYTTLFFGVDPERGVFVGADPVLHNPTKFFISIEFKQEHVEEMLKRSWFAWERVKRLDDRPSDDKPVEVLVGGTRESFLRYVRFEREALREDQGHRQLLAEQAFSGTLPTLGSGIELPSEARLHQLSTELELQPDQILDLISNARRLKMAVRGWVAEIHLERSLSALPGVTNCRRLDHEGSADIVVTYGVGRPIYVECKNVLREAAADGTPRIDFQRTRAAKSDACSRYYKRTDFDVVAACLHAVTRKWEYRFRLTSDMAAHSKCVGRLASNVRVSGDWLDTKCVSDMFRLVAARG